MKKCQQCGSTHLVIPNKGRLLCGDCSFAEIDDELETLGLLVVDEYGPTRYRRDTITPRIR